MERSASEQSSSFLAQFGITQDVAKQKAFTAFKDQLVQDAEYSKIVTNSEEQEFFASDNTLACILKQRDYKVADAIVAWKKWAAYMHKMNALNLTREDVKNEIAAGGCFFFGRDKQGNLGVIVKVKQRMPGKISIEETERFIVYLLREAVRRAEAPPGNGKITLIWDREGFTRANHDERISELLKTLSPMLQDVYLDRLDRLYIVHPNWFFRILFTLYKPFISERFRTKFKMVSEVKDMVKYFDGDQLLHENGGTVVVKPENYCDYA